MEVSKKGAIEIASHEAFVLSPYYDSVGVLTVFVGHTANAGGIDPADLPMGIEQPIAMAMEVFQADLKKFSDRVNRAAGTKKLKQHEHDGATSFDFNTGSIFTATWFKQFLSGEVQKARTAFMYWRRPTSIIERRRKERDLFFDAKYGNGIVSAYPADKNGRIQWGKGKRINLQDLLAKDTPVPIVLPPNDPMADGLLIKGERGAAVEALVKDLNAVGYKLKQPTDQLYDNTVKAAVAALQMDRGLKVDGIAGPKTFDAVEEILAALNPPKAVRTPKPKPQSFWVRMFSAIFNRS